MKRAAEVAVAARRAATEQAGVPFERVLEAIVTLGAP
jgi:hypothetical protein